MLCMCMCIYIYIYIYTQTHVATTLCARTGRQPPGISVRFSWSKPVIESCNSLPPALGIHHRGGVVGGGCSGLG